MQRILLICPVNKEQALGWETRNPAMRCRWHRRRESDQARQTNHSSVPGTGNTPFNDQATLCSPYQDEFDSAASIPSFGIINFLVHLIHNGSRSVAAAVSNTQPLTLLTTPLYVTPFLRTPFLFLFPLPLLFTELHLRFCDVSFCLFRDWKNSSLRCGSLRNELVTFPPTRKNTTSRL